MDPEWLKVGMVVAPWAAKAAERAAERSGEQVADSASQVMARFAGWLQQKVRGHPSATALARVEETPHDASRVRALGEAIAERAVADPEFAAELRAHVEQARAAGVQMSPISQSAVGDGNVQVADVSGSVSVTYGAQSGPAASR